MRIFKTAGEGSCGVHAVFGEYDTKSKLYKVKKIREKRREFAEWIEAEFKQEKIPPLIEEAMMDYLTLKGAPKQLKKILSHNKIAEQMKNFQDIIQVDGTIDDKELRKANTRLAKRIKKEIIREPVYQKAYLEHIRNTSNSLCPEELGAFALKENINLRVYQGPRKEKKAGECNYFLNDTNSRTVEIYLGNTHYERAYKTPVSEV